MENLSYKNILVCRANDRSNCNLDFAGMILNNEGLYLEYDFMSTISADYILGEVTLRVECDQLIGDLVVYATAAKNILDPKDKLSEFQIRALVLGLTPSISGIIKERDKTDPTKILKFTISTVSLGKTPNVDVVIKTLREQIKQQNEKLVS
jgi:hypothetical protein